MILEIYEKHFNRLPKSNSENNILFAEEYHVYAKNVEKNCYVVHMKLSTLKDKDLVVFTVKDPKLIGKDKLASCTDIMHILGYDGFLYVKPYDIQNRGSVVIFKSNER